mgnify:CR=1 FL=1
MTHAVPGGGSANVVKNPELLLFNRELSLIPFIQDIASIWRDPGHRVAVMIEHPVEPTELADVEVSKLQALDLFQLDVQGMKMGISVFLRITPIEGGVRGIVAYLASWLGRILERTAAYELNIHFSGTTLEG